MLNLTQIMNLKIANLTILTYQSTSMFLKDKADAEFHKGRTV